MRWDQSDSHKQLNEMMFTLLVFEFIVDLPVERNVVRCNIAISRDVHCYVSYSYEGKCLLVEHHEVFVFVEFAVVDYYPLGGVCSAWKFGIVVYPFVARSGQAGSQVSSDPTGYALHIEICEVALIEVYERCFSDFQTWRGEVVAVFGTKISRSRAEGDGLRDNVGITSGEVIGFDDSNHEGIVAASWMWDIDILVCLLNKDGAASLSNLISISIIGWDQFSEITHIGKVVELAEPNIEI